MSEQWSEKDIELANRLFDMARDGDTAQLKAYLDAGVSTRLRNHAGDSFLTLAAYHEHPDTVAMLIAAGAEVEHAELRNVGTHSWPVWRDDLKKSYDTVFKSALGL